MATTPPNNPTRPVKAFGQGNPELARYAEELFAPVDAVLEKFYRRSKEAGLPDIQVGPMDGRHLEVLSRMIRPRRAVEIGTLGGYSALCIARGMEKGGILHSFEKSEAHAKVAEANMLEAKEMGAHHVDFHIHVGSAIEMLPSISDLAPFDLVFVDADKPGYPAYLEWAVKHLRSGGVVIGDNTFAWGEVHLSHTKSGNDQLMVGSLDKFNREVAKHPQLRGTMLPTAEGLTLAVKL